MWPRLQRITFDLSTFSDLIYIRILEGSPQSIIVRIVEPAFDLTTHEKVCRLETMKIGDPMMDKNLGQPLEDYFGRMGISKIASFGEKPIARKDQTCSWSEVSQPFLAFW